MKSTKQRTCAHCKKPMTAQRSTKLYCSAKCRYDAYILKQEGGLRQRKKESKPKQAESILFKLACLLRNKITEAWRNGACRQYTLKVTLNPKAVVIPAAVSKLADLSWAFAHAILWKSKTFTDEEILLARQQLMQYYAEPVQVHPQQRFIQFLERVILAKLYISRLPGRYITHPCIWLNRQYAHGFSGTASWYNDLLERRRDNPGQGLVIKNLAELYADYSLNCSARVFPKAIKAFSANPFMQGLFNAAIAALDSH